MYGAKPVLLGEVGFGYGNDVNNGRDNPESHCLSEVCVMEPICLNGWIYPPVGPESCCSSDPESKKKRWKTVFHCHGKYRKALAKMLGIPLEDLLEHWDPEDSPRHGTEAYEIGIWWIHDCLCPDIFNGGPPSNGHGGAPEDECDCERAFEKLGLSGDPSWEVLLKIAAAFGCLLACGGNYSAFMACMALIDGIFDILGLGGTSRKYAKMLCDFAKDWFHYCRDLECDTRTDASIACMKLCGTNLGAPESTKAMCKKMGLW